MIGRSINTRSIRLRPEYADAILYGPSSRPVNVGKLWGKSARQIARGKAVNHSFETVINLGVANTLFDLFVQDAFSQAILLSVILGTNSNGRVLFFGKDMPLFSAAAPVNQPNVLFGNGCSAVGGIVYPLEPTRLDRGQRIVGFAPAAHTINVTWQLYVPSLPE